jgi:hypothetical protein
VLCPGAGHARSGPGVAPLRLGRRRADQVGGVCARRASPRLAPDRLSAGASRTVGSGRPLRRAARRPGARRSSRRAGAGLAGPFARARLLAARVRELRDSGRSGGRPP